MMARGLGKAPLDLLEEQPKIERLGDPPADEMRRGDPIDVLSDAAENDAMRPARSGLLEGSKHLAAGHVGHPKVGDHEGKWFLVRQAQAVGTIRGERNLEIQPAK
jgi:hypothetical protein